MLTFKGRDDRSLAAKQQEEQCLRIFNRETASFSFTWQRAATRYAGGFETFLWERHSKPPPCEYVEVFYQDDTSLKLDHPRRTFMTVSTTPEWLDTTPLLSDLRSRLNGQPKNEHPMWQVIEGLSMTQDVGTAYALLPLFLVFEQAIHDTARFIQQAHNEVMKIVSHIMTQFLFPSHNLDLLRVRFRLLISRFYYSLTQAEVHLL